jgi:hypothetical protein
MMNDNNFLQFNPNEQAMIKRLILISVLCMFLFSCSEECDCDKKIDEKDFSEIWFPKEINSKKLLNFYSETDTTIVEWNIIGDTIIDGEYAFIEANKMSEDEFFFYWFVNQDSSWRISSIDGTRERSFIFPFVAGEWQEPHRITTRINKSGDTIQSARYLVPQGITYLSTNYGTYDECWKVIFYDVIDSASVTDTFLVAEDYYAKNIGFVYKIVDSSLQWEMISYEIVE